RPAGAPGERGTGALPAVVQQVPHRRAVRRLPHEAIAGAGDVRAHLRPVRARRPGGPGRTPAAAARLPVPSGAERPGAVLRAGDGAGADGVPDLTGDAAVVARS